MQLNISQVVYVNHCITTCSTNELIYYRIPLVQVSMGLEGSYIIPGKEGNKIELNQVIPKPSKEKIESSNP